MARLRSLSVKVIVFFSTVTLTVCLAAGANAAETADPEGVLGVGQGNSLVSATDVGELPLSTRLSVLGWISSADANDVDLYRF